MERQGSTQRSACPRCAVLCAPGDISYRKLFESDPGTADGDRIFYFSEEQNYNGPATLRAKVALAKEEASGVMIWELSQDALGDDSLLKVIWEAAQ